MLAKRWHRYRDPIPTYWGDQSNRSGSTCTFRRADRTYGSRRDAELPVDSSLCRYLARNVSVTTSAS